jgi:hypothetical protein
MTTPLTGRIFVTASARRRLESRSTRQAAVQPQIDQEIQGFSLESCFKPSADCGVKYPFTVTFWSGMPL